MQVSNLHCVHVEVFQYTLEHASEQLSRMEQEKESKIYKEVHNRFIFNKIPQHS